MQVVSYKTFSMRCGMKSQDLVSSSQSKANVWMINTYVDIDRSGSEIAMHYTYIMNWKMMLFCSLIMQSYSSLSSNEIWEQIHCSAVFTAFPATIAQVPPLYSRAQSIATHRISSWEENKFWFRYWFVDQVAQIERRLATGWTIQVRFWAAAVCRFKN